MKVWFLRSDHTWYRNPLRFCFSGSLDRTGRYFKYGGRKSGREERKKREGEREWVREREKKRRVRVEKFPNDQGIPLK